MKKTAIIIPFRNQSNNFDKIIKGLEKQSVLPDNIYLLLDRGSIEEIELLNEICNKSSLNSIINISYINELPKNLSYMVDGIDNPFLTGYIRNFGIDLAQKDNNEIFLFIDGDCIPQTGFVKSHLKKLSKNLPVLTVGRRRESQFKWQDKRDVDPQLFNLKLFSNNDSIINNPILLEKSLIVWSCNIGLNINAIKLLKRFNLKYYQREEVFCSEFLGKWGGEDGFLGIECYYCRIFITMIGDITSGIEHIDHPRPDTIYTIKHIDFFKSQCSNLRKKVTINPLSLDFFEVN